MLTEHNNIVTKVSLHFSFYCAYESLLSEQFTWCGIMKGIQIWNTKIYPNINVLNKTYNCLIKKIMYIYVKLKLYYEAFIFLHLKITMMHKTKYHNVVLSSIMKPFLRQKNSSKATCCLYVLTFVGHRLYAQCWHLNTKNNNRYFYCTKSVKLSLRNTELVIWFPIHHECGSTSVHVTDPTHPAMWWVHMLNLKVILSFSPFAVCITPLSTDVLGTPTKGVQ